MLKKLTEKIKAACSMMKMRIIGIDYGEPGGDHTAVTQICVNQAAAAGGAMKEALIKLQATTETTTVELLRAAESLQDELKRIDGQNTNNWRKMHGLPMRRKRSRQKKRK